MPKRYNYGADLNLNCELDLTIQTGGRPKMTVDYFGSFERKESYVLDGGRIAVLDDFDAAHDWVKEYAKSGLTRLSTASKNSAPRHDYMRGERSYS